MTLDHRDPSGLHHGGTGSYKSARQGDGAAVGESIVSTTSAHNTGGRFLSRLAGKGRHRFTNDGPSRT